MTFTSNHLLCDLAVRKGRHRCEGVPVRGVAQAQLTGSIAATDEHPRGDSVQARTFFVMDASEIAIDAGKTCPSGPVLSGVFAISWR